VQTIYLLEHFKKNAMLSTPILRSLPLLLEKPYKNNVAKVNRD